jgi:hypothetical protein
MPPRNKYRRPVKTYRVRKKSLKTTVRYHKYYNRYLKSLALYNSQRNATKLVVRAKAAKGEENPFSFSSIKIRNPRKRDPYAWSNLVKGRTIKTKPLRARNPSFAGIRLRDPYKKSLTQKSTTGAAARGRRGLEDRGKAERAKVARQKAAGKVLVKGGKNVMSGRKWLGPAGSLGDDVIVEILPTVDLAMEAAQPGITSGKGKQNGPPRVDWAVLWGQLNQFYLNVVQYLKEYIGKPAPRQNEGVVPTDTGTLRRKMWQSLERQWYSKTKMPMTPGQLRKAAEAGDPLLVIVLNTGNLKYARPVNQMSTRTLAHPHDGSRNWGNGGPLVDPSAQNGWYNLVLVNGQNQAKKMGQGLSMYTRQPRLIEINYK